MPPCFACLMWLDDSWRASGDDHLSTAEMATIKQETSREAKIPRFCVLRSDRDLTTFVSFFGRHTSPGSSLVVLCACNLRSLSRSRIGLDLETGGLLWAIQTKHAACLFLLCCIMLLFYAILIYFLHFLGLVQLILVKHGAEAHRLAVQRLRCGLFVWQFIFTWTGHRPTDGM